MHACEPGVSKDMSIGDFCLSVNGMHGSTMTASPMRPAYLSRLQVVPAGSRSCTEGHDAVYR